MKLDGTPCQLPINMAFSSASGLLRSGGGGSEPGRENVVAPTVLKTSCDLAQVTVPPHHLKLPQV